MTTPRIEMVTPAQAEELAQHYMEQYVKACNCQTNQDVANVLMKLTSMCGLGMMAIVGQDEAVARIEGDAQFIAKFNHAVEWQQVRSH